MDREEKDKMEKRKTAVVIGGSRGIGRAVALRLAKSGFDLLLTYQGNHEAAAATKREIEELGRTCRTVAFNIAKYDEAQQVFLPELETLDSIDACVFNAGICRDNVFALLPPEDWHDVIDTNLNGFYHTVQPVVFRMIQQRRGRIVAITSISGDVGQAGQVNYSASKAGLAGAVRALAREVGPRGIFVNAVSPGVIDTEMTKDLPKEQILPLIPVRRYGTAEEVAAVVDFLCSEPAMYIQGQTIRVNGGMAE